MTAMATEQHSEAFVESRYKLPANMEMANLAPVHAELVALLAKKNDNFVLDGAELSTIDTSGIQLLINFVRTLKEQGCRLSWENYSIQAWQLANELGLDSHIGD